MSQRSETDESRSQCGKELVKGEKATIRVTIKLRAPSVVDAVFRTTTNGIDGTKRAYTTDDECALSERKCVMDNRKILDLISLKSEFSEDELVRDYFASAPYSDPVSNQIRGYLRQLCNVKVLRRKGNVYRLLTPLEQL